MHIAVSVGDKGLIRWKADFDVGQIHLLCCLNKYTDLFRTENRLRFNSHLHNKRQKSLQFRKIHFWTEIAVVCSACLVSAVNI